MYEVIFLFCLALIWILFATIQDIKTREVADWLCFSLVIFALGFRFFYSLFYKGDFQFFYQGLIGFGIFFVLGNLLYYGRMFAGGDAKLMMALGAVLPLSNEFYTNLSGFMFFLILFLFSGAVYGLLAMVILSFKNFKNFKKEFKNQSIKNKNLLILIMACGLILMIGGFFVPPLFLFGIFVFVLPYLYVYAKAVDEGCMVVDISTDKLTEGDWIYQDVKVGKEIINANWDGLTKEQIRKIKKKHKKIKIKQGIPFVPTFLISFIFFIYFWKTGLWYSFW